MRYCAANRRPVVIVKGGNGGHSDSASLLTTLTRQQISLREEAAGLERAAFKAEANYEDRKALDLFGQARAKRHAADQLTDRMIGLRVHLRRQRQLAAA